MQSKCSVPDPEPDPDPPDPHVFGHSGSGSESGFGSISQKHGSEDPDPPQNIMDLEHCPNGSEFFVFVVFLDQYKK
jgi:hypothetical protein